MNRETPFNPDDTNFSGENNEEQKNQVQRPKELIDQEKTDLAFKKTVNEFKDIAKDNPVVNGFKKIFRK